MPQLSLKIKFAVITTILLWSSAFVGIRVGLLGYTPGALALFRFLLASLFMLIVYLTLPKRSKIPFQQKVYMTLAGVIGIGVYNSGLNYGEVTVSSGIASFVISQSPILTTLFAIVFLKERLKPLGFFGIFISFTGVSLILMASNDTKFSFDIGFLYLLAATFASAAYSILQKPFLRKYHAIEVTSYVIWGGTLGLLLFLPELVSNIQTASRTATLTVIYLGIFPAGVAYLAWNYVLAAMPVSVAVNYFYFMPLVATLLGWLCLGEVPSWLALIGGVIALFGVYIVNHSHKRSLQK